MTGQGMGLKCPRCGKDQWAQGEVFWNLWVCQWCQAVSTIQHGMMELYAPGVAMDGDEDAKAEAALRKRQTYRYPNSGTD